MPYWERENLRNLYRWEVFDWLMEFRRTYVARVIDLQRSWSKILLYKTIFSNLDTVDHTMCIVALTLTLGSSSRINWTYNIRCSAKSNVCTEV